jgi:hypothetical protein
MGKCFLTCPDCDEPGPDVMHQRCHCYPAAIDCPSEAVCREDEARESSHVVYGSGMVRSAQAGKPDYTLLDLVMLERRAAHMTAQVPSKGHNNWRLAHTEEDLQRFLASAWRHFIAWQRGDTDEDHAAALCFNVDGAELVRRRLSS